MHFFHLQNIEHQLRLIADGVNNPWAVWLPLLGTFAALFLGAGGGDWMRSWFKKPKLDVSIKVAPPDCHKTSFYRQDVDRKVCDTYYFRFRIANEGNLLAEDVEAMVTEVQKKVGLEYQIVESFLPLNLLWSHYRQVTMPKIQPKLFKHIDFGFILKHEDASLERFSLTEKSIAVFSLDVAVMPNTGSHILFPGDYKVKIIFTGNNTGPIEKTYHLVLENAWSDSEEQMLRDNVSIAEDNA